MLKRIKAFLAGLVADEAIKTRTEHRTDRTEDQRAHAATRASDKQAYADDRKLDRDILEAKRKSHRRLAFAQLGAYLLFVTLGGFIAYDNEKDNKARCEAGVSSRAAQRDTINEVADLALQLTKPPEGQPTQLLTPEARQARTIYKQRVETFRDRTLEKIVPNAACAKYGLED